MSPNQNRGRRQRPKRSKRMRRYVPPRPTTGGVTGPPAPAPGYGPGFPPDVNTSDLSMPVAQPTTSEYPAEDSGLHAVTTNQEPFYSWPPVELPPLSGFTVGDTPADNGQVYMSTAYDTAAPVSDVPYNDYDVSGPDDETGEG